MHALGGRVGKLGPSTRQQLWELQKLYFLDDEDVSVEHSEASGQKRGCQGIDPSRGPEDSNDDSGPEGSRGNESNAEDSNPYTKTKKQRSCASDTWDWGPQFTAADAIRTLGPYMRC